MDGRTRLSGPGGGGGGTYSGMIFETILVPKRGVTG